MAGGLFTRAVAESGSTLLPIDSEHNAIFQCLPKDYGNLADVGVRKILLTASGGPFRTTPMDELASVTPDQACAHPNWDMGRKISVDSASMMNKGLELIEACWLFDCAPSQIEVVVHPQSVIHSMIELADNSVKAQLGPPDMRLPIQYAMFHPDRMPNELIPRLDIAKPYDLSFQPLEVERYPCFSLAVAAGKKGGTYPTALSAADEVAVGLFLDRQIGYMDIGRVIDRVLDDHHDFPQPGLEQLLEADRWARAKAHEVAGSLA